ncbi:outer membrane beta-barrel protein [Psychromonas hadalis]|uniref:outer membrane beta-barrel protein n=1 Tax=Psychromonas hadalis TaxID=211669 RepID=UPI0003B54EE9|nr:outer membrane beta-barrel protein [Psychromonas hadalis]
MKKMKKILAIITLSSLPLSSFATPVPVDDFVAISVYLGGRYSEDLTDSDTGQSAEISNNFAQALALSWYYGRNTEGELLYSNSKQDFTMSDKNISTKIYISYLHFGGRVNFVNESPFSTSIGLGIGATFFVPDESQYDNDMALSGNITGGMRYELSDQWALKADLRVFGTVLQNDSSLFCGNNQCLVNLDGEVYVQTELMAGVEYKF